MSYSHLETLGIVVAGFVLIFILKVLKRKIVCPDKTLKNCFINELLTPVRMLKLGPFSRGERQLFDLDINLKYAMKKTNLSDFGDSQFVETYNSIMQSAYQKTQVFTNLGYISAKIELNLNFVRRLTLIQYLKDQPKIQNIAVREPVFVMGLPRTGTTFLHRLLSLDPASRAPLLWELLHPVPKPTQDYDENPKAYLEDREKRAKFIKKIIATRKSMGDHAVEHIHEVEYDLPEECLMGLSDSLPCMLQYLNTLYMTLDETVLKWDSTKAYADYKNLLRILSYQTGEGSDPKRWTLKCPIHLFYVKHIAKVFPDAKLIWTHRHPVSAVPSLCSLIQSFHSVYYEPECIDAKQLGRTILDRTGDILKTAADDVAQCNLTCGNVVYNNLISDPIGTVKNIYTQMGWEFTPEYQRRLNDYLVENKKKRDSVSSKKHGGSAANIHHYSPESYGITEGQLCSGLYGEYIKRFDVPMSKN